MMEKLFSYGTLRTEEVQLAVFGHKLEEKPDALPGYRLRMIEIHDEGFVLKSGTPHHRNLEFTSNESDVVEGLVLSVTKSELQQADAYEPEGYERVLIRLKSGVEAWVYLNTGQTSNTQPGDVSQRITS